jgi:hypothetical protein
MVAAATARRLAGDWRGACAAGLVDVHVDLREVASRYGTGEARRIEAELTGLAPDLLRRFLPRTADLALTPRARVVLSRLETPLRTPPGSAGPAVPVLVATLPQRDRGAQRVGLGVVDAGELQSGWYDLPDWCWHADAVAGRRRAYGASPTRLAWHGSDGTPYRQGASTPPGQPADRATEVETIDALLAAQLVVPAWEAAGFTVDLTVDRGYGRPVSVESRLEHLTPTLPVLAAETRRLAHRYGLTTLAGDGYSIVIDVAPDGGLTVRWTTREDRRGGPFAFGIPAPVDVALLRWGSLSPDELHPLVHRALFPGRTQDWYAATPAPYPPIPVRCGPVWHTVRVTGARLSTPDHTDQEIQRELVFAGLGGAIKGCAAAVRAWRTGAKPVPKEIRKIRRDLFALVFHGDTDTVLDLLAEGIDPGLRDGLGATLMHWLDHLDHVRVLPVLAAAGVSVRERDRDGNAPLHRAALARDTGLVAALLAAGADPDARNAWGRTAAEILGAGGHARGSSAANR